MIDPKELERIMQETAERLGLVQKPEGEQVQKAEGGEESPSQVVIPLDAVIALIEHQQQNFQSKMAENVQAEVTKALKLTRENPQGQKELSDEEQFEADPMAYIFKKAEDPDSFTPEEKRFIARITLDGLREGMNY